MKSNDGKLELRYLHVHDIQINFNLLCNLLIICKGQKSVSSFYEEDNFEPCLTKQLLTMFKLGVNGAIDTSTRKLQKCNQHSE